MFQEFVDLADDLSTVTRPGRARNPLTGSTRVIEVPVLPTHGVVQSLASLQSLAGFYHPGLGTGLSPQAFVLEVIASLVSLERQARQQDALARSGTASEARKARKTAESMRHAAQRYVDALPDDWPDLVPSYPTPALAGPTPTPIGRW